MRVLLGDWIFSLLLFVGNDFAGILVDIRNRLSSVKTLHISKDAEIEATKLYTISVSTL